MTVTLTLTDDAADAVREACELYGRVAMGQFTHVGTAYARLRGDWPARDGLRPAFLAAERLADNTQGIAETPQASRLAWDLYRALAGDNPTHHVSGWAPRVTRTPTPENDRALLEEELVTSFARAMREKLAVARAKGRGGWDDPLDCTVEHLWGCLVDHAEKSNLDFVDVANLAAFIWWRINHVPGDRERLADLVRQHGRGAYARAMRAVLEAPNGVVPDEIVALFGTVEAFERETGVLLTDALPIAPPVVEDTSVDVPPPTVDVILADPQAALDVDLGHGRFVSRDAHGEWTMRVPLVDGSGAHTTVIDARTAETFLRDAHAKSIAALGRIRNGPLADEQAEVEPRARIAAVQAALEALREVPA